VVAVENMPVKRLLGREMDIYTLNHVECSGDAAPPDLGHYPLGDEGTGPARSIRAAEGARGPRAPLDFKEQEHLLPGDGHLPLANCWSG